mgnify:CR=1 FL=1
MKLDLGTAIIGGITMLVIVIPIYMMMRGRKKKEKMILRSLLEIAAQKKCTIDQHEILGTNAIGIDENNQMVFFYRQTEDQIIEQFVDLKAIESCKVVTTHRTISNKGVKEKLLERLDLRFVPSVQGKGEIIFEFFNADDNIQLNGELQSAEKWSQLIHDRFIHR